MVACFALSLADFYYSFDHAFIVFEYLMFVEQLNGACEVRARFEGVAGV